MNELPVVMGLGNAGVSWFHRVRRSILLQKKNAGKRNLEEKVTVTDSWIPPNDGQRVVQRVV